MKRWSLLLAGLFLAGAIAGRADEVDPRFSSWLTTTEQKEVGLERLTSDQVGVLDALVRRDLSTRLSRPENAPAEFSQRLTPDERKVAGLGVLTPAEVARVDMFVGRYTGARLARTLLAPPVYVARPRVLEPAETKKERQIHGSFSLSMGWGSGGYSTQSGSMVLRFDDPEHNLSINVGISETRIKGPAGGGYYRDPYYRDPFETVP